MYLFIATHLGSGASMLCDSLSRHGLCAHARPRTAYKHASDLLKMKEARPVSKIYFDKLVWNFQFCCPSLYTQCKFIYVVREAKPTLSHLIKHKGYSTQGAYLYYTYRLRRLCEMAKKTPDAMLLTFDDIASTRAFTDLQTNLGLRKSLEFTYKQDMSEVEFPHVLHEMAQARYERHFAYLANIFH